MKEEQKKDPNEILDKIITEVNLKTFFILFYFYK